MKAFIYQWTNKRNGKKYIGSHIGEIDDGYIGSGKYFKNAYNKEPHNFEREILEIIESENIKEAIEKLENKFISKFDASNNPNYYNISPSYFGGDVYSNLSEEDQKKMVSPWKEAGRIDRLENPEKYKKAHKKRIETRKSNAPEVYQFTIEGELIKKYDWLNDAHKEIGGSKGNLSQAVKGHRNYCKGYRWSYSETPNPIITKEYNRKGKRGPQKNPSNHTNIVYREILQYDLDDNYIKTWKSAKEIEKALGISGGIISHCIHGRYKGGIYKNFKFVKGNKVSKTVYKSKLQN